MMDYCTHYIDAIGTVSRACTLTGDMASVITIIIVIAVGCACMWSGEIMTGDLPTPNSTQLINEVSRPSHGMHFSSVCDSVREAGRHRKACTPDLQGSGGVGCTKDDNEIGLTKH